MQGMTPTTRLPGESAKAYAAWQAYLAMGTTRSSAKVAQECSKHVSLINRWSLAWKWQERLLTAATEQAAIDREAKLAVAIKREEERQRRELEAEDLAYGMYKKVMAKVEKMVNWPLAKTVVDGETGQTVIMPVNWRFGDAARMGTWGDLLRKVMTGKTVTAGDIRAANGGKSGTAIIPAANGTPGVIIHIEGGEDDEDEIEYLPTNVTQLPPQGNVGG